MRCTEMADDARRAVAICNACRYCEGLCDVFPAIERRRAFADGDLNYLANLCHGCRGCFYACQYAPPHEFDLNLPKVLAGRRAASYATYAWPTPMAGLFARSGTVVALASAVGIAGVFLLSARPPALHAAGPAAFAADFYAVIPERVMIGMALVVSFVALLALLVGVARFWRDSGDGPVPEWRSLRAAWRDVLTLRNLGGAGHGCNDAGEAFSQRRRRFHHALFYGFLLCLASTTTAAIYTHLLGRPAPYPLLSLPVLLGTVGGVGMTVGVGGLLWLKVVGDPMPTVRCLQGGEYALLVQLLLAATSGLLLLALRESRAMAALLSIHLGIVLSFIVLMPYGKFVHGLYRAAALVRSAGERDAAWRPATGNSQ